MPSTRLVLGPAGAGLNGSIKDIQTPRAISYLPTANLWSMSKNKLQIRNRQSQFPLPPVAVPARTLNRLDPR